MRNVALALLAFLVFVFDAFAGEMDRLPPGQSPAAPSSTPLTTEPVAIDEAAIDEAAGSDRRLYGEIDYLQWWLREGRVPPIVTTGPAGSQGILGQPGTSVVFGDDRLETRHGDRFSGLRFRVGGWLDQYQSFALEAGGFFLERDSTNFNVVSEGSLLLARPLVNAQTGQQASEVFAGPSPQGLRSGGFNGYSRIEFFSEEGNLVARLIGDGPLQVQGLIGGRFLQMRDRLDLTAVSRFGPSQSVLESVVDHYRVHDAFYGGQVGLRAESSNLGRWLVRAHGLVALGADDQEIRAFGDHIYQTPLVRTDLPGGLTVLPSNIGTFHRAAFDAVYEVGVDIGYRLTRHCRLAVGYTFLGWNNPIRAGDQVDSVVNPSQINGALVGPARPAVAFKEDFFWAQGFNANLEFGW